MSNTNKKTLGVFGRTLGITGLGVALAFSAACCQCHRGEQQTTPQLSENLNTGDDNMSAKPPSADAVRHITVGFGVQARDQNEKNGTFTRTYAVSEEVAREFKNQKNLRGIEIQRWLDRHGGLLDSTDGPAAINSYDDGEVNEMYYIMGRLCRSDTTEPDGSKRETYSSDNGYAVPDGWPPRTTSRRPSKPRGPG